MSPWRMMEEWGVPTFYLQAMTNELLDKLAAKGAYVPDIAIAGGFSTEDHVFKVLAMGAPYTKAVCMGRALMIPGFVGKNIEKWIEDAGPAEARSRQFGTTQGRDLRHLRDAQGQVRRRGRQLPAGRPRHLHLLRQDQGRPAAAHERQPQHEL